MATQSVKYSHIIWDWNGTLLDDSWLCVEVMNTMLAERYLPLLSLERYRDIFVFPVKDYYTQLGFNFDNEPFEKVGMEFMILYNQRQHECSLHIEVKNILETISRLGFPQSILSAREENELRSEVIDAGINRYFQRVYGLDDHYAHGKTDVGRKLIHDLGSARESYLFIGDTLHDAEVASELGISCILVPNGHHSLKRLKTSGLPVIDTLKELIQWL
ncbi:MAG: HAD hydrolase-like protein [Bacteroidetes bacterium]|nr:HAD hydrolase-like protein [Bacteroidota bacterium]